MAILAASTLYLPCIICQSTVGHSPVSVHEQTSQSGVPQNSVAQVSQAISQPLFIQMQAKVKLVADAVWSKLTGVFVNDVLHVQVGSALPHLLWIFYIISTKHEKAPS